MSVLETHGDVASHVDQANPRKCALFKRSLIYCGLHLSEKGITVDSERLQGLKNVSSPETVGDVWRFKSSVGWIRNSKNGIDIVMTKFKS